jgi:parallel beta-helix repeat protein
MHRWYALLGLALISPLASAAEVGPSDDLEAAIAALAPGEVPNLRGGVYVFNSRFLVSPVGTASNPITIRSKPGERAHIRQDSPNQNIIEVQNARYFVIDNLEFSGGSHGIRLMSSSDITVSNCEIHDTGDVALSANSGGTYERLKILDNHIHHTNGTAKGCTSAATATAVG